MKIIGVMNGWRIAPHCWARYLSSPPRVERTRLWTAVSWLGWRVFFEPRPGQDRPNSKRDPKSE